MTLYGEIQSITQQMLQSAKREDWDILVTREESRQSLLERAFEQEKRSLDSTFSAEKSELIRNILSLDHQTRDLLVQKMVGLREHFIREKNITEAYGPHVS